MQFHCFIAVVKWLFRNKKLWKDDLTKRNALNIMNMHLLMVSLQPRETSRKRTSQKSIISQPQTSKTILKQLTGG